MKIVQILGISMFVLSLLISSTFRFFDKTLTIQEAIIGIGSLILGAIALLVLK